MFSVQIDTARSWRGGQHQVVLATLGLRARGHRVTVVANPDGELRRRLGDEVDVVPLAPRNEVDLPAAWRLSRVLRDLRPDVVHAHDSHGVAVAATALSIASSDPRPPLVFSRRVDFHLMGNSFSRWKYRQVDCFVAASDAIRTMLVDDGVPPDRTVTIRDGIDVERVERTEPLDVRQEFWFPPNSLVVGNIAALVPHKGQKYLVDAAATVVRERPEARFVILGEGELKPEIERQIRHLHLGQHVVLAGFRTDVIGLLKGFDLFAMSSVTEGLGSTLLDAMAARRPVVATRAGGIPEVVTDGETGVLVPTRDALALARAILALLADEPRRHELALAGWARVRRDFSADRMVDATIGVYERLVRRTSSGDTARRRTGE